MERFGIPQTRHRLIILGIREDLADNIVPKVLRPQPLVNASSVLSGLPRVRSGLTEEEDSKEAWLARLSEMLGTTWVQELEANGQRSVLHKMEDEFSKIRLPRAGRGAEFIPGETQIGHEADWFLDHRIGGVCNHTTRAHKVYDLHRYFFASCFAKATGRSPILRDFPKSLLPDHANAKEAASGYGTFSDRFRVQMSNRPSKTITSHIAKDGHYYIHHDPTQCRSLTVREAARLQTFKENYFFCGSRSAQYIQVGNAVPPLLAKQIAKIVFDVLERVNESG